MLQAEAEPWEPIPGIQNNNENEPKTIDNSNKNTDATSGWNAVKNDNKFNCNNNERDDNKKNSKCKVKDNMH